MFASNFIIADSHLRHIRGRKNLTSYSQSGTIGSGKKMTNFFCTTCGSLMYRVGEAFPGHSILRLGTVDDFNLHETKLRPRVEQFTKDRVGWLHHVEGVGQVGGTAYSPKREPDSSLWIWQLRRAILESVEYLVVMEWNYEDLKWEGIKVYQDTERA